MERGGDRGGREEVAKGWRFSSPSGNRGRNGGWWGGKGREEPLPTSSLPQPIHHQTLSQPNHHPSHQLGRRNEGMLFSFPMWRGEQSPETPTRMEKRRQ